MDAGRQDSPNSHWIALITEVIVKHPWFVATLGFCAAYYLRAVLGYDRFFKLIFSREVVAVVVVSMLVLQPAINLFYGAEIVARYGKGRVKAFNIPDRSLFYPTITSDIGVLRKCAAYLYAMAQTVFFFTIGAALCIWLVIMIFFRGPVPTL